MRLCVPLRSPGAEFELLQNLTEALSDDDSHDVIRFANSLFLQEGVTFNPEFLHLMRKYFKANVETVDFSESAAVAEHINSWVENHTESEYEREGRKRGMEGGRGGPHPLWSFCSSVRVVLLSSPNVFLQVRSESCCPRRISAA